MRRAVSVACAVLAGAAAAAACGRSRAPGTERAGGPSATVALTSTAFAPRTAIPTRYSCDGANVPPPLHWAGVPSGTAEVAFTIEDPDAPKGTFVHWIVTGLPPTPEGDLGTTGLPPGARQLPGSAGRASYVGPCPPHGGTHHYYFQVLALERHVEVPDRLTPLEKVRLLRRSARARGQLIGTFTR